MDSLSEPKNSKQIFQKLKNLENRISRIEKHLEIETTKKDINTSDQILYSPITINKDDTLEFHIGQYWFAKIGIVVLAIGIAFLLTFPYQNLPTILPCLIGYILVALIFGISQVLRKSFELISRYLLGGSLVLLYFTTMRLYFFGSEPVITNLFTEIGLLLIVVALNLYISARKKSVYLTGIHLTLGYITAIVSGNDFILLFLNTLFAIISVILFFRYKWYNLLIYATFLTYFTHFVWFINNPFLGNRIELVSSPQSNLIFIFVYTAIFAFGNIYRGKDFPENIRVIISTFLNSIGGYSLFLLITLTKFKSDITVYQLVFSILFLTYSIFFWIREKSKYSTFFYAILGYSALSVAIISGFEKPDFFIWLCWQSVIVIITALLFRSNIIIVANFLIYLVIFFAYLIVAENISIMVLSFGIVALISARIMNWQKDRLELKTELMRNSYLTSAFFIFPYGLYHLVPEGYISISWLLIAFMYYLFSVILKNNKYRWMALFTILLTVLYIFIIGIIRLEPLYRIISFLALGLVLIITSLLYTKLKSKQNSNELKNG